MDRHSFCGHDCTILNASIGSFTSIASDVSIGVGGRHPLDFVSTSPAFLSHRDSIRTKFAHFEVDGAPRTSIGSDVWIGEGSKVKAGVFIGDGAVVGMGSIVTHDVEPYAIVAGSPARVIKYRFDDVLRSRLLELEWWTWSDEQLLRYGKHFNDPIALIEAASK